MPFPEKSRALDRSRAPADRLPLGAETPLQTRQFRDYKPVTEEQKALECFFNKQVVTHAEIDYISKLPHPLFQTLLDSHTELEKHSCNSLTDINVPIRYRVLMSNLPPSVKTSILLKINTLSCQPMQASDAKYLQWVETCLQLPLGKLDTVGLLNVPGDTVARKIETVAQQLDMHVYGHQTVKQDILRRFAQSSDSFAPMLLLGPPGVGKTRMVKHAMAKVAQRKFLEIPLGGATNADFLRGSLFVYEGSSPGHLVQGLIRCQSMNPVIFFDELCKVSGTAHGAEVMAVLMHITDQSQQHNFEDKYLAGVALDLSQCQLIFAANAIENIDPILRDRLDIIKVSAYSTEDKREILKRHLIPDIKNELHVTYGITFSESAVQLLLSLTEHEPGVRSLKRHAQHVFKAVNAVVHVLGDDKDETTQAVVSMGINTKILDFVRAHISEDTMVVSKEVTNMLLSQIDIKNTSLQPSLYI